jgi:uncharacterized protein YndB with AHSA1/START domain
MRTMTIVRTIRAPRSAVYRTLLDANDVAAWRVPQGMTSEVHVFEPRQGGAFRVSLTYESKSESGKTSAHTDTYHGHFIELVPDERIVERLEFETDDPALAGEMKVTTTLRDVEGGTELSARHEGLPPGVSLEDNELGWRMSLEKLARVVEGRAGGAKG